MNATTLPQVSRPFTPHRLVRRADVQTVLSTLRPRGLTVEQHEQPVLLDAGVDQTGWDTERPVRLHGYFSPRQTPDSSRGLVLVLHGWEGCSHSVYNLITTDTLNRAGFDVFRLNVRDHGPGLHLDPYALNRGFFMGTLFDEIAIATGRIAEMALDHPFYIVGASMGGNLALRLAIHHARQPLHNLAKVITFNPAINPKACALAMDSRPLYRRYFRTKWLRSLRAKQQRFPQLYDFTTLERTPSILKMTEWVLEHYGSHFGDFNSSDDYFLAYSILGDAFQRLTVPTTIVTAADDQVVPVADFLALTPHPLLNLQIHASGGHVGYVDLFPLRHNLPRLLLNALTDL